MIQANQADTVTLIPLTAIGVRGKILEVVGQ